MFSDVIHVKITFIHCLDMSHAFRSCKGLPVIFECLPVMQRVCLPDAMTAIVIHTCHNDVMM